MEAIKIKGKNQPKIQIIKAPERKNMFKEPELNVGEKIERITIIVNKQQIKTDYYITSHGRVWSNIRGEGKWLKIKTSRGYGVVSLSLRKYGRGQKAFSIHRLVAQYFIPNPHNLPVVHHKDNKKLNNHVDNLKWVTYSENTAYAYFHGKIKTLLSRTDLFNMRQEIWINKRSEEELAKMFGVPLGMIKKILKFRLYEFAFKKIIRGEFENDYVDTEHRIYGDSIVLVS